MKYLVEITLNNSLTIIYNYYNTETEIMLDLKNHYKGIEDVKVYTIDNWKSINVLKHYQEVKDETNWFFKY